MFFPEQNRILTLRVAGGFLQQKTKCRLIDSTNQVPTIWLYFGPLIYPPPGSFRLPHMSISVCPFLLWHLRRARMARAGRGSGKQRIVWIGSSTHGDSSVPHLLPRRQLCPKLLSCLHNGGWQCSFTFKSTSLVKKQTLYSESPIQPAPRHPHSSVKPKIRWHFQKRQVANWL